MVMKATKLEDRRSLWNLEKPKLIGLRKRLLDLAD